MPGAQPVYWVWDHQSLGMGEIGPPPRGPPQPNCAVFSSLLFQDKQLRIFDPRAKPEASQVSCVGSGAGLRPQRLQQTRARAAQPLAHRFCHAPCPWPRLGGYAGVTWEVARGSFWEACSGSWEDPALITGWGQPGRPQAFGGSILWLQEANLRFQLPLL